MDKRELKCSRCEEVKLLDEFCKASKYPQRYFRAYNCKDCANAYTRKRATSIIKSSRDTNLRGKLLRIRDKNIDAITIEIKLFITKCESTQALDLYDINNIITLYDKAYVTVRTPFDTDDASAGIQLDYMYKKMKEEFYD